MTITLTPETEARVRSVAEMHGVRPEEAFTILLNQALAKAEQETQRTLDVPRASVENRAGGHEAPSENCGTQTQAGKHKSI